MRKLILFALCGFCILSSACGQGNAVNTDNYVRFRVKEPGYSFAIFVSSNCFDPSLAQGDSARCPIRVEYNGQSKDYSICPSGYYPPPYGSPVPRFTVGAALFFNDVDSVVTIYGDIYYLQLSHVARLADFGYVDSVTYHNDYLLFDEIEIHNDTLSQFKSINTSAARVIIHECRDLTTFLYQHNQQSLSLEFSGVSSLRLLDIKNNNCSNLVLSGCSMLGELDASNNLLESIDLRQCPKLDILSVSNNKLQTLDISRNTLLREVDCSNNCLESLSLPKNRRIGSLRCNNNKLSTLNISNSLANNLSNFKGYVNCSNNNIHSIHAMRSSQNFTLSCEGNNLSACALDSLFMSVGVSSQQGTFILSRMENDSLISNPGAFTCRDTIALRKNYRFAGYYPSENTTYDCAVIELTKSDIQVKTYPNPVKDLLCLETEDEILYVKAFDIAGRALPLTHRKGDYYIDCTSWRPGFHILKICTDKGTYTYKVTKL